jgi:hypothetical protein
MRKRWLSRSLDEPRFFSPAEAIAQLPHLKPLLVQLREAFHEYRFAKAQVDELQRDEGPIEEREEWERKARDLAAAVEGVVRAINEVGADVKDPLLGLVDFYHKRRDGSIVLLCYRDDEATITSWHALETGFVGRRPLKEL